MLFLNHAVPFGEQKQTILLNSASTFKAVWRFGNVNGFSISSWRWETASRGKTQSSEEQSPLVKAFAHLPGLFTEKLHSSAFLCISLTLKTYRDSSITTAYVSTGPRDDFYLLCLFSPWLQRFSSNSISITKELAKNEHAETEVKGCCASHKPIIKHRFDSIIHVLW